MTISSVTDFQIKVVLFILKCGNIFLKASGNELRNEKSSLTLTENTKKKKQLLYKLIFKSKFRAVTFLLLLLAITS